MHERIKSWECLYAIVFCMLIVGSTSSIGSFGMKVAKDQCLQFLMDQVNTFTGIAYDLENLGLQEDPSKELSTCPGGDKGKLVISADKFGIPPFFTSCGM